MATPRTGVNTDTFDPDLDFRLLRLENGLLAGTLPGATTPSPGPVDQIVDPSTITGISVSNGVPGTISVRWNLADSDAVNFYELHFSTERTFSIDSLIKKFTVDKFTNSFLFTEGDPDKAYFFRVRAVTATRPGFWSVTFDAATGKATSSHFEENSIISVVSGSQSFFPFRRLDGNLISPAIETIITVPVEVSDPHAIMVFGRILVGFSVQPFTRIVATISANGVPIQSYETFYGEDFPFSQGKVTLSALDLFDPGSSGANNFSLSLTLELVDGSGAQPGQVFLEIENATLKVVQLVR